MQPSKRYPVPLEEVRREIVVVNSRFIATLAPAFSVEQARAFIQRVRGEFPDASHHVPAYRVGHGDSVVDHCSDAGEPAGTAGQPALAVLRGSGLGDAAVVVVRYFGGTKLGTGGLVRAYSEAVRQVVQAVPRGQKVLTAVLMVEFAYTYLERMRRLCTAHHGQVLDEEFGAQVVSTLRFALEHLQPFEQELAQLTNGKVQAQEMERGEVIMPLGGEG